MGTKPVHALHAVSSGQCNHQRSGSGAVLLGARTAIVYPTLLAAIGDVTPSFLSRRLPPVARPGLRGGRRACRCRDRPARHQGRHVVDRRPDLRFGSAGFIAHERNTSRRIRMKITGLLSTWITVSVPSFYDGAVRSIYRCFRRYYMIIGLCTDIMILSVFWPIKVSGKSFDPNRTPHGNVCRTNRRYSEIA